VLVRKRLGRGTVYFFTDPIELTDQPTPSQVRRQLYAAFLHAGSGQIPNGPAPLEVTPNEPWLHLLNQPTANGTVHVVYNTKRAEGTVAVRFATAAGDLEVITRNGWPALAAVTRAGGVAAVISSGKAKVGGNIIMDGQGLKGYLSLDGADLRKSQAILVAPFEIGRLAWPEHLRGGSALVGEFCKGNWTTLERLSGPGNNGNLEIDADRATCLVLLCSPDSEERWTAKLSEVMQFPEKIPGF
jgi:hypothetical protein